MGRQLRIVELVEWTLTNVDPWLISDGVLGSLAQHIQQARDYLNQWKAGAGPDPLTVHAGNVLDAALASLGSIPVPLTTAEASAEIASLRRSVGQHRGQVDREIESLHKASDDARGQFATLAHQAETRAQELEAEIARLREELSQLTAAGRELSNQQQNAFTTAQTERQEAFSRLLEEKREETAAVVAELKKAVASEATMAREAAVSDLEGVNHAKTRVEEILGIVGEEALVGTYSKNASDERAAANLWRWIAVGTITLSVAIAV